MTDNDKRKYFCVDSCKVIFFDVGFTLVDETECWLARCAEQAAISWITTNDLYRELQNICRDNLPQFRYLAQKYGFAEIAPYRCEYEKLYPDTKAVLETLSRNYKLGVIANQSADLTHRLSQFGILRYFHYIVSSAEYGASKPDMRIFQTALYKANCTAAESVMIGDRIDNDIVPAKQIGMKTIRIKQGLGGLNRIHNERERPDCEVNCLTELLPLFE